MIEVAAPALEHGDVLHLPGLAFAVACDEQAIFSPAILSTSKNASYDPGTRRIGGTRLKGGDLEILRGVMARFSDAAASLVDLLLPRYRGRIARARSSFRPAEIAGRATSWRKDDTRLHVDSFPASPVQGRRILRVFTNVNPAGRARAWRIGGDFETLAERFGPALPAPSRVRAWLLHLAGVTKSRRSEYDAMMLALHDLMKQDSDYQAGSPQVAFDFPSGSTWLAFTDQVPHAAMAGQYQLEQTFLLPIDAMMDEAASPLRILERVAGRRLA
jgi:hypothetical protein